MLYIAVELKHPRMALKQEEFNLQAGFPDTFFLILHKIVDIPPDFAVIIWVSLLHSKG